MDKELILLSEYCERSRAEADFIIRLENEGLIEVQIVNDSKYLPVSQLSDIEMFSRLYYDLSINIEGIDVINNLLGRMKQLERELSVLKRHIDISEGFFFPDFTEET